jgi:glycosyl transferase family 25
MEHLADVLRGFDRIAVINLPHRKDRRREIAEQLAKVGLSLDEAPVSLFPAHRPDTAGPFPSIGAHGCFMSHLGVLRAARADGVERLLILEDDADLAPAAKHAEGLEEEAAGAWDFLYLGHGGLAPSDIGGDGLLGEVAPEGPVWAAHSLGFSKSAIEAAGAFLEAMLTREPGDPEGGPMHVDGAYFWLRRTHPALETLAARHHIFVQRPSRTDIANRGLRWQEKLPGITALRRLKRRLTPGR